MAGIKRCALRMAAIWIALGGFTAGAEPAAVLLQENANLGSTVRTHVGLKGEGLFLQAPAPGSPKGQVPKPLTLKVEVRLEYLDRVLKVETSGQPARSARRIIRAGSLGQERSDGQN